MPIEVIGVGKKINPDRYLGHTPESRLVSPTVFSVVDLSKPEAPYNSYELAGLCLPTDWYYSVSQMSKYYIHDYCEEFKEKHNNEIKGTISYDEGLNLIIQVRFRIYNDERYSQAYLCKTIKDSGFYIGQNIKHSETALIYHDFLSQYLDLISVR